MLRDEPLILFIDLFCGFGGTTEGVEKSFLRERKMAQVIACVNHDENAINSHYLNHPHVKHFTEDIRTLDLTKLLDHIAYFKALYPTAKLALWASLECTNHSNAKGGMSRDADSRTLADDLFRYIDAINELFGLDYVFIENVREFEQWGPLRAKSKKETNEVCELAVDKKGKLIYVPVKESKGVSYEEWVNKVRGRGYTYSKRLLVCADYGMRTIRKRLFIQFAKHGLPVGWPEATHDKKGKHGLPNWLPVRPLLDLEDTGESLFALLPPAKTPGKGKRPRKRKYRIESEATRQRVLEGCIRFIAKGDRSFLLKHNSTNQKTGTHRGNSLNEPICTVTCGYTPALIFADSFIVKNNSSHNNTQVNKGTSLDVPAPTITCMPTLSLATVESFIVQRHTGSPGSKIASVDAPARTVTTTGGNMDIISVEPFIVNYYSTGGVHCSLDNPCTTIPTKDRSALVTPQTQAFLLDMQYGNGGYGLDRPAPTIIALQNKKPLYLITTEEGDFGHEVYDDDSPVTVQLKQFMVAYRIQDIKMRHLNEIELLKIQDFPPDYKMVGTKAERKKFIGNAVPPGMACCIIGATAVKLLRGLEENGRLSIAV